MGHINQKESININFSNGLGIFDKHYGYPEIDDVSSIRIIQFFSRTGTDKHAFHFNELSSTTVAGVKIDEQ
ncbi:MAG: hypothetical protein K8R34_11845 [Methanosarcinales archaeon]|nr:hypothetical protein [Methanosarcinales archaeon]